MHTFIQELRQKMKQECFDAILIVSSDLIAYYTGIFNFSPIERDACMFITLQNAYIFTDSRFLGISYPKEFNLIETSARSGAYSAINTIVDAEKIQKIGYEESELTVKEYKLLKKVVRQKAKIADCTSLLSFLRVKKTPKEINKIKKACKITDSAFSFILDKIYLGVTETQLAQEIDNFFKEKGATPAFQSIVAFGKNASIPHHHPSNKKLTLKDTYILLDIGARYDNYCSDLSRTIFFGSVTDEIRNQYGAVKLAQEKALCALKLKKRTAQSVDSRARTYLKQKGYTIPHAVGHGLGIHVHEAPTISPANHTVLEENMIVTIEPGVYIPKGGIRIEDTVQITETGYKLLTHSTKEIIVIRN